MASGISLDDWQSPDLPWEVSDYEEIAPKLEEPEEEHSASEDDYMDMPIPEPSDQVLRWKPRVNYRESKQDDLFLSEEGVKMPSMTLMESAIFR